MRYDVHQQYGKVLVLHGIRQHADDDVAQSIVSLRAYDGLQYALIKASVSKDMRAVLHRLPAKGDGKGVVWKIDVHDAR